MFLASIKERFWADISFKAATQTNRILITWLRNFICLFNEMRNFIYKTDFVLRTRNKFYKILDSLKQMILCSLNVHINILEIKI